MSRPPQPQRRRNGDDSAEPVPFDVPKKGARLLGQKWLDLAWNVSGRLVGAADLTTIGRRQPYPRCRKGKG